MKIINIDTNTIEEVLYSDYQHGQEDALFQVVANCDYLDGELEHTAEFFVDKNGNYADFRASAETIEWLREAIAREEAGGDFCE